MARPTKASQAEEAVKVDNTPQSDNAKSSEDIVSSKVEELMKLYPHYDEFYVTPAGFVRPKGSPEYLTKGATLYKNKYHNIQK